MYSIRINNTDDQASVETVIDSERVEVDNCFGTTTISRSFTFMEEIGRDFQMIEGSFSLGLPTPFTGLLEAQARSFHGEDSGVITRSRTETLSASPGTRPRWQMTWYRVSLEGTLTLTLNDQAFDVTYQLTNELRSDLISIPSTPCPTS